MSTRSEVSFVSGQTVVLQEVWRDRIWSARPMTVVRDEGDFVALWFPEGTRFKRPIPPPTRIAGGDRGERLGSCLALCDWVFEDAAWDVSTLVLMRPGEWHAAHCSWRDAKHLPWYVNLQEPFARAPQGFKTMDLALDVVIRSDGMWYWKDEDELATFVRLGVFGEELASRLRAEGSPRLRAPSAMTLRSASHGRTGGRIRRGTFPSFLARGTSCTDEHA